MFRLTPTVPVDENGHAAHVSDDMIMVERSSVRGPDASIMHKTFDAASVETALEMVVEDLKKFLEHVTSEEAT